MKYLIYAGLIIIFLFLSYWSIVFSSIYIAIRNDLIKDPSNAPKEIEEHPEILDRIMIIFYRQLKAYLLAIIVAIVIFLGWKITAG